MKEEDNKKSIKPRFQWFFVGSNFAEVPYKDYDIIDTVEDRVVESYNSPYMVRHRLKALNSL